MGSTYSLEIGIDKDGLNTITSANQKVAIVMDLANDKYWLVCSAFSPSMSNTVTWSTECSVYASSTEIQPGKIITIINNETASLGSLYNFINASFQLDGTVQSDEYGVKNSDENFQSLTTGLAKIFNINSVDSPLSPTNANVVPYGESGLFKPIETVQVFVASGMDNGLIIDPPPDDIIAMESAISISQTLTVDFTETTSQTIHYDDSTNAFIQGALPG